MTNSKRMPFQIHANVNSDHGDNSLRVTITYYDVDGSSVHHQTWRGHSRALWFDNAAWDAYSGLVDLAKLLAAAAGTTIDELEEPDESLPGL